MTLEDAKIVFNVNQYVRQNPDNFVIIKVGDNDYDIATTAEAAHSKYEVIQDTGMPQDSEIMYAGESPKEIEGIGDIAKTIGEGIIAPRTATNIDALKQGAFYIDKDGTARWANTGSKRGREPKPDREVFKDGKMTQPRTPAEIGIGAATDVGEWFFNPVTKAVKPITKAGKVASYVGDMAAATAAGTATDALIDNEGPHYSTTDIALGAGTALLTGAAASNMTKFWSHLSPSGKENLAKAGITSPGQLHEYMQLNGLNLNDLKSLTKTPAFGPFKDFGQPVKERQLYQDIMQTDYNKLADVFDATSPERIYSINTMTGMMHLPKREWAKIMDMDTFAKSFAHDAKGQEEHRRLYEVLQTERGQSIAKSYADNMSLRDVRNTETSQKSARDQFGKDLNPSNDIEAVSDNAAIERGRGLMGDTRRREAQARQVARGLSKNITKPEVVKQLKGMLHADMLTPVQMLPVRAGAAVRDTNDVQLKLLPENPRFNPQYGIRR